MGFIKLSGVTASTMTTQLEDSSDKGPLPEDWEMRVDTRTGLPYYLNHSEKFTTWDDPRVVSNPRSMLNRMGPTIRRSTSPTPDRVTRRVNHDGSTSIPFNHFIVPRQLDLNPFEAPFPRARRANRNINQRPFGSNALDRDDWFGTGFDEPDDDFFSDASWPIKSHSLRMRSQPPPSAGVTGGLLRQTPTKPDGGEVPKRTSSAADGQGRNGGGESGEERDMFKTRNSPRLKQVS